MSRYRWHAAVVLFLILAHTHVTVLPGWTVPAIPLLLVSAAVAMTAGLWGLLRHGQRPAGRRYRPALAGG
jgi:ABC-type uncharacterized transport system permease subunit